MQMDMFAILMSVRGLTVGPVEGEGRCTRWHEHMRLHSVSVIHSTEASQLFEPCNAGERFSLRHASQLVSMC